MSWMLTYDGVFFISIATILAGSFGLSVRYCLKSKCEHFSLCCGLLSIDRRVDLEVQEELAMMELGQNEEIQTDQPKNNGNISPKPSFNFSKLKRLPHVNKKDIENKGDDIDIDERN